MIYNFVSFRKSNENFLPRPKGPMGCLRQIDTPACRQAGRDKHGKTKKTSVSYP